MQSLPFLFSKYFNKLTNMSLVHLHFLLLQRPDLKKISEDKPWCHPPELLTFWFSKVFLREVGVFFILRGESI